MALLTIAIPTRNRREYAVACIRCVLRTSSQDLEVVVQDNSDSDELGRSLQEQFTDERLRYAYEGGRMSVVENCNRALSRATGEYVTLLGDDDGVNPEIIDAVRWA